MRWLVLVLVVINMMLLGFFLAGKYLGLSEDAVAPRQERPHVSKIKIISPEELANMHKKMPISFGADPTTTQSVDSCYEWGGFAGTDVARAQKALKQLKLDMTRKVQTKNGANRYWIYLPSQKSLSQAEAKVAELKVLGVTDSFIVQEAKWRYAISLGIFKEETLADGYLKKLHELGIRNVVKTRQDRGNVQTSYVIQHVTPDMASKLLALKPQFSGSELTETACP